MVSTRSTPFMSVTARPYELTFEHRPHYLFVRVTAPDIDREIAIDYLTEVARRFAAAGTGRLMLVRDIPVMLRDSDLFFTAKDFLRMIGHTTVAFVNPHAEIADGMQFAVMIGNNRGAKYNVFANEIDAEAWLLKDLSET